MFSHAKEQSQRIYLASSQGTFESGEPTRPDSSISRRSRRILDEGRNWPDRCKSAECSAVVEFYHCEQGIEGHETMPIETVLSPFHVGIGGEIQADHRDLHARGIVSCQNDLNDRCEFTKPRIGAL